MTPEVVIHPESLRFIAYEILNQLTGGKPVDTSTPSIYDIEYALIEQYGYLQDKDDKERLRLGQNPDLVRVSTKKVILSAANCDDCDKWTRYGIVDDYMTWDGKPYIKSISTCGTEFIPAYYKTYLKTKSQLAGGMPTFAIEGTKLIVYLTPQVAAINEVEVTGIIRNPFSSDDKDDPNRWRYPWLVSAGMKALAKEQAQIVLKNGVVATWQRRDVTNNGLENPNQKQQ